MHSLFIRYRLRGGTEAEHAELREALTPALTAVPELMSLSWLSNGAIGHYGGFFIFERKPAFDAFVSSELYEVFRSQPAIRGLSADDFSVEQTSAGQGRRPTRMERRGGR
jgi:hypothetical protein